MAVSTNVRDGSNSLFWKDRWILGRRIQDNAPLIFSMVLKRFVNKKTVLEAIQDERWIGDIRGVATVEVIHEFLRIWDMVSDINLQQEVSRLAYMALD
jgi:hypothetical protein